MTTSNSIVPQDRIQAMNTLAMVLLTMSEHYDLPDSVNYVIQDMQDEAETLLGFAILNKTVNNIKLTA